jgi:hypothetical protein
VLGRSWPTERLNALGFPDPGLPARRVQQVLQRLALYGLVGHAPGTEACYHRAVRAPQCRGVWVVGKVEAVACWQLRWFVCLAHAACYVTRRVPDQTLFTRAWEGKFCELRLYGVLRSSGAATRPRAMT